MSDTQRDEVRQMIPEPAPPTPRCSQCNHSKRDHSDRRDHTPSTVVPRRPWCHACSKTCDYEAATASSRYRTRIRNWLLVALGIAFVVLAAWLLAGTAI